jgi:hypothetical protein
VTKVIRRFLQIAVFATGALLVGATTLLFSSDQDPSQSSPAQSIHITGKSPAIQLAPAESLYLRLRAVGLDKNRVYRIRDITLDRAALHLTFDDGTIAFTEDVDGRVTGAFFEGEGEILLTPPDRTERASLALFTNEAILEESFSSAYIRFNDDTFSEMQPYLKPADDPAGFIEQWNPTAVTLAGADALRLLLTFSRDLPVGGQNSKPPAASGVDDADKFLHARIQGRKLGGFDVCFDARAAEQLWAGQLKTTDGIDFYNLWTSFNPVAHTKGKVEQGARLSRLDLLKITDYKIRVRVTPPTRIEAEANLHLQVQRGGERAVLFELSRSLQISEVQANDGAVEYIHNPAIEGTQLARRGNDLVAVIFPKPLEVGQVVDLKFRYAGDVLSQAGPGLLYVGARGIWYPNRGLAMANFDLQFQYPQEWTLVATGEQQKTEPTAESSFEMRPGDQIGRWVSNRPIPVAGFNLGKYQQGSARAGDVAVQAFATPTVEKDFPKGGVEIVVPAGTAGFPQQAVVQVPLNPSPARNAQSVAEQAASAVDFYSTHFGPYPFIGLALTQIPGAESQGWPGLIFLSSLSFLSKDEIAQLHMPDADKAIIEQIVSHETAHQWWGDLVGWNSYRDQWWVEALANYSSLMALETRDPAKFRAILDKYRDDLLEKNEAGRPLTDDGAVTLGTRLSNSVFPSGYTAISYGRGTWLFHMLRHMLLDAERASSNESSTRNESEEPFLRGLRRLRERYAGKTVTTQELLAIFEEELPQRLRYEGRRSLDWFHSGWISGTAIPKYELKQLKFVDQGGSTLVTGILQQKEAPDDLVTAVPLYASRMGKVAFLSQVLADGPETHFRITAPTGTRKIVIDPQGTILSRPK